MRWVLGLFLFFIQHVFDCLTGPRVMATSNADDPRIPTWASHICDLKMDTLAATLPDTWHYRVIAKLALCQHTVTEGDILISNFYLSLAEYRIAGPQDTLWILLGHTTTKIQTACIEAEEGHSERHNENKINDCFQTNTKSIPLFIWEIIWSFVKWSGSYHKPSML